MKAVYLIFLALLATTAFSQSATKTEVQPDGSVTFRLSASNARDVQLMCDGLKTTAMQKDSQDVWSFTAKPLAPDYYAYAFLVDGLRVMDLSNPEIKYNLFGCESEVHVPGPASLPWELNDVPHGVVHAHIYKSAAAGDERSYYVYTPPGYQASDSSRSYPTLYLLHGYSDDSTAWWSIGRVNIILDNLIARGEVKPMVVVMPLGYGTMDIIKAGPAHVHDPELQRRNLEGFTASLLKEVMPRVESAYRVSKDRNARAIAGVSMGGGESLKVGLNNLDLFAWIGAFSAGDLSADFPAQFPHLDAKAAGKLRLLWMSCGTSDHLVNSNRAFVQWLKTKDVPHDWPEVPGAHGWQVWRRNLAAFAPLLFR